MLAWMKQLPVPGVPDVVAFGDDPDPFTFYVLPKGPSFRRDSNGLPVFKFLKYRNPIDRPGKKGGGFLICDVAFALSDAQLQQCKAALQQMVDEKFPNRNPKPQVQIRNVGFTRSACTVQLLDGNGPNATLVERIQNPAAPSLYGDMVTPITVEMSPEGAILLEQALQDRGGVVQIAYDLFAPVKLPAMTVTVWFHASKFMEFRQSVEIDWRMYGDDTYRETIHEKFTQTDSGGVDVDPGSITDQKIVTAARDWGFQQLDDAVKRMILGDIAPVSEDARKVPDGMENVYRNFSVSKVADFRRSYRQGNVIEVNVGPRGTLPNITSLTGPDGKPLKWSDFARVVDLDDPFFKRVSVNYRANVDFAGMPIKSVDVTLRYANSQPKGTSFAAPEDVGKQEWALENNNWKYKYQYLVNYKNESRQFKSEETETDAPVLTINVGDSGLLHADIQVGDMDFDQVSRAVVTLGYEDAESQVPAQEWKFSLDATTRQAALTRPIFAPRKKPFKYQVKYTMKDGREFVGTAQTSMASQIFIGDPFQANKTFSIISSGNLDTDVASIFIDLKYVDEKNKYSQTTSVALSKNQKFFNWTFPVVDELGGKVTYTETIQYTDGRSVEKPEKEATKSTIIAGPGAADDESLTVDILPDLLNFEVLKLAKVTIKYEDQPSRDFVLKPEGAAMQYKTRITDRTKRTYTYSAEFFLKTGKKLSIPPTQSTEATLLVEQPAGEGI